MTDGPERKPDPARGRYAIYGADTVFYPIFNGTFMHSHR